MTVGAIGFDGTSLTGIGTQAGATLPGTTATYACFFNPSASSTNPSFGAILAVLSGLNTTAWAEALDIQFQWQGPGTGQLNFQWTGGSATSATAQGTIVPGTWYFLAVTVTGTTAQIYYCAVGAASLTLALTQTITSFTPAQICVGSDGQNSSGSDYFDGSVAGLKVWTSVLTSAQLFAETVQIDPVDTTNLFDNWRFNTDTDLTGRTAGTVMTALYSSASLSTQVGPPIPDDVSNGPDITGSFQDLLQFSQDTLYNLGEAFSIGNSAASTITYGFSNTGGALALAAAQTTNQTVWYPSNSSGNATLLTNINFSAGTTSNNLSAVTFSNSNGVSFGLNGSVITASVNAGAVNFSAGTTSNNLTAITFSNSNGISFGLNGSTMTASVATSLTAINVSAGTTSNNLSAVTFSNSNGISFGLNGSILTASIATSLTNINFSAGTTSNNLSAIVFSNKDGISFGLSGSTVTAILGGFSNWANGAPVASFASSKAFVSFQPILLDYAITATNVLWLGSLSQGTASSASSGGYNISIGLYTLTGGTSGTLSLASSATSFISWTSGGAYSSVSGVGYRNVTVASWDMTPGPYMFAIALASTVLSSISMTLYGTASLVTIGASGQGKMMSSMPWLPGYSVSSIVALPASFGVSNTASFVRTGSSIYQQPWISFQGT